MLKEYEVTCEVDMYANCIEKVRITTTRPQKAMMFAGHNLKKKGHFYVSVISCKEVKDEGH